MVSVLLAGGGTAGHVNPLLATADALLHSGHDVAALGTEKGLEAHLVPDAGIDLHLVPRVPLPRRPSLDLVRLPARLAAAVAAAGKAIDAIDADVVVGFGGYVSAPAYLAARRRRLPVVVHEGNARPGLANRLGARGAAAVALTFEGTPLKGGVVTGLPLRPAITELARQLRDAAVGEELRRRARATWGWAADAPTLLITGGSTGAASLNAVTAEVVERLVQHGIHVLHLTGKGKADGAEQAHGNLPARYRDMYVIREYVLDMETAFAAADAVVCRAGAGMVCEVSALGLPAVYVPLAHGNGEQALNAKGAVDAGAASIVHDGELTAAALELAAEPLVLDHKARQAARAAAASIGITDGAERLARIIERAAKA
ncbi:UDP-N-acetylglucosamine--N-acetylmuramyl-(pentapeptide) pyrophosphoryl-undecaprenol N-acetylglucosamine transferase [Demequina sp.]|uniref:UDP-N-acetylglucosamine--N-acetylmuramyl- (pentapeptide) pyrophosphoryl-undecaprenol N-acetylglucosamine transferase n=1 Tax=Demequina sp. TaxID=2050685 RepID=UPI0025C3B428|nr:UDP-N-acetylglucosamine--N-acetylmuramyl-(pentapeptide) pyrophosphoryl-undecaprenol N-acetylglucosamine transferase [Demequina sp.]